MGPGVGPKGPHEPWSSQASETPGAGRSTNGIAPERQFWLRRLCSKPPRWPVNHMKSMVGARGFEPPTPSPPDWCANQAALRSAKRLFCRAAGTRSTCKHAGDRAHARIMNMRRPDMSATGRANIGQRRSRTQRPGAISDIMAECVAGNSDRRGAGASISRDTPHDADEPTAQAASASHGVARSSTTTSGRPGPSAAKRATSSRSAEAATASRRWPRAPAASSTRAMLVERALANASRRTHARSTTASDGGCRPAPASPASLSVGAGAGAGSHAWNVCRIRSAAARTMAARLGGDIRTRRGRSMSTPMVPVRETPMSASPPACDRLKSPSKPGNEGRPSGERANGRWRTCVPACRSRTSRSAM